MRAMNPSALPLAPHPKQCQIPLAMFAENDGERRVPSWVGSGQKPCH